MKKGIWAVVFICASMLATAQGYERAIGVRSGPLKAFTYKQSLKYGTVGELMVNFRGRGLLLTGLLEHYRPLGQTSGLWWFYGFGGHMGIWRDAGTAFQPGSEYDSYGVGVDGIIGVEYNFDEMPINVSLDWKPAINLISNRDPYSSGFGLSARYVF